MTDRRPAARRPGLGLVVLFVLVMLAIGIGLMVYAVQVSGGWFVRPADTPDAVPARAMTYTPAQPQPAAPPLAAAADPETLATRESALAGQLAAIEARTGAILLDAASAGGQAARAEGVLVAFAARRAVDRGIGLGYLEEQLRQRFAATRPRATTVLIAAARQPVTLASLRQGFDAAAPRLVSGGGDLLTSLGRELGSLVVIRRADTPSMLPSERAARVRALLDAGQVEAATAEVRRLPGAASATDWLAAARRWSEMHRALDAIEAAAILGQASPPPAPPSAVPTLAPVVPQLPAAGAQPTG